MAALLQRHAQGIPEIKEPGPPFISGRTETISKTRGKPIMEAPELERRLAAILAADVEEYSRLMHSDEETTMSTLSARRAVVDALIAEHRGRIANTAGDSILAEFVSVLDAISCAVAIQHASTQWTRPTRASRIPS